MHDIAPWPVGKDQVEKGKERGSMHNDNDKPQTAEGKQLMGKCKLFGGVCPENVTTRQH